MQKIWQVASIASSAECWHLATMSEPPSQSQDKFIVRLPDGMRDRIKAAAEANNRSMNAEIVATLEEKYPVPKRLTPEETIAAVEQILAEFDSRGDDGLTESERTRETLNMIKKQALARIAKRNKQEG